MKTRILSGLLMMPLLLFVYVGGQWLAGFVLTISLVGLYEFYKGFNNMGVRPSMLIGAVSTIALYLMNMVLPMESTHIIAWIVGTVIASCIYIFKIEERKIEDSMATILGVIYIVLFAFHLVLITKQTNMALMIWVVIISAFATDTMAYFVGFLFGKHKLCPVLSPKKTIEGAVGGALGSILLCGLFGYFIVPTYFVQCLVIGLVGGILSQCGDLTASAFKRKMGIKDYGNLIPGHGGVMDRVDSVIFIAPFVYYFLLWTT